MSIRTLIVEDEALIRWTLRQTFEERGYEVVEAETGQAALDAFAQGAFDLVMLDYRLPDVTGLDVLRGIRRVDPDVVVIMMTAYSTIETAVEAIKLGAFNYVTKPFQIDDVLVTVDKGLETTQLRREVRAMRRQLQQEFGVEAIIGRDPGMLRLFETIRQVARTGVSTVFLQGETGTGKDLVARVIHHESERASLPFVNITCTALSETLLESELFGHERGAFTDAKLQKKGLFEMADGGTVFLDEVGDMPGPLQAKLLRFLEERRFRRVGGTQEISVDVRVISATNRDLERAIAESKFRRDLLYRLNVVTIVLPPLRARGEDVRLLTNHFVERFAREFKKPATQVSPVAHAKLAAYEWPGNVRELRNVLERAVLLSRGDKIGPEDIVLGRSEYDGGTFGGPGGPIGGAGSFGGPETAAGGGELAGVAAFDEFNLPLEGFDFDRLKQLEGRLLRQAMERCHQNQSQAARLLRISRDRLRYKLQRHGLL